MSALPRTITVSSRALGPRLRVTVKVYDDVEAMRRAGQAFNGNDQTGALGVTQCSVDEDGRTTSVIVRLTRDHLGTQILGHELHHAAAALYGATLPETIRSRDHLNHFNEPFAHLFSDLLARLVIRLYDLGYYGYGT